MEINEALGIAKSLKNHFKAFEELDRFIVKVAAWEGHMGEIESQKATIQKEIGDLKEEKMEMSKAIEAMKPIVKETEKAQKTLDDLKGEIRKIKAKLG